MRRKTSTNRVVRGFALAAAILVLLLAVLSWRFLSRAKLPKSREDGAVTLLLIGTDNRSDDDTGRSDTILLVSVNRAKRFCSVASIMRDLYVTIPGHGENRINAAYSIGGAELLRQTLEENLQITVDGTVQVDFSAFQTIIDRMGGVEINLTEEEAEYLRGEGQNIEDGEPGRYTGGRTYDVQAGLTHMDGTMALDYARARHVGQTSDFGRTNRQRELLKVLVQQAKSSSLPRLFTLMRGAKQVLDDGEASSDLTWEQLTAIGMTVLDISRGGSKDESDEQAWFRTDSFPQMGHYQDERINRMAVLVPTRWEEMREALRCALYE